MTSAPPFLLRPLSTVPCLAVGVSLLGGFGVSGCFFELPELVPEAGIGGVGGSGAQPSTGGGGSGAGGSGGTSGGSAGTDSCSGNSKTCGGVCVSNTEQLTGCGGPSCEPCQGPDNVVMGCGDDGACRVEGCVTGFADCDGDALGKSGPELTGSSGCEYSFGEVRSGAQPLSVPEQTMFVDGSRTDWTDIPAYAIDQACEDCSGTDDRTAPVVSPRSVPVPQDLTAYFRIAWDASNLYVLAEAFDNGLVSGGDATREDGVLLLFDGLDNREPGSTYGNDDTRVYIGLSDAHVGFNRGLQQAQLQASHQANGLFCYRIEAQISWRYIVGFDEQNSQGKFPPTPNQTYGFDISINDWDPAPGGAEPVVPEHRNQIFWVNPGDEWWFRSQGFGGIKLVGEGATPSDAGVQ